MQKRLFFLIATLLTVSLAALAQVTTSGINGKVTAQGDVVIGATITAKHVPSGAVYRAVSNVNGRYSITGMRSGGPYEVEVSYIGYQSKKFTDVQLSLGQNSVLDVWLSESSTQLKEVEVVAASRNTMRSDRSGAVTNLNLQQIAAIPTVSRQMTDLLRMTPQSSSASGLAIGGGNYRQSNVTIDGASFNNTFGMGSTPLPGGGTPISLEALDQMTVSITPYDVRQSGFNGGGINAVTKSGTNEFKGSAYTYLTSNSMKGNRVGDEHWQVNDGHSNTYGVSLSGPILKDKLFFFTNFEYDDIKTPAPTATAGTGKGELTNTNRRPTLKQLESLSTYLRNSYGLETGPWQGFSVDNPSYRFLARVDWNINDDHKFNVRFTKSGKKNSSSASASRSIGGSNRSTTIYGGAQGTYGSGSYYSMSSLSSRYYSEYNFMSIAAELNSKFGKFTNTLRGTYSYQDQPRSNEYGENVPVVEILMNDGQNHYPSWALTGDIFTRGNLVQTKNLVLTDEVNATFGIHNLFGGIQFEHTYAANRYMQAAAGYYAYEATQEQVDAADWAAVFGGRPRYFAIAYGNNANHDMFMQEMSLNQWSLYFQDNMNITDNFRLSAGIRFELPSYPALKNNYNEDFYNLDFGGNHYRTDEVPGNSISVSPRVGFNWDITGDRKYILRGGTGLFVGRMPFVWLVSAMGNSGVGQSTYTAQGTEDKVIPTFTMSQADMLDQIGAGSSTTLQNATIISSDLRMPKTWKTSLAFDTKLPGDIDFTLEGIYNRDLNPVVVSNKNVYWDGTSTVDLGNGDVRHLQKTYTPYSAFVLENAGSKAYYFSLSAQLRKELKFGDNRLNLMGSYTHSHAKSYSEGIGDQIGSAYNNYRASIHAVNDNETGYATYVAPNRVLLSASFKLQEGKYTSSTFSLIYDGYEYGYLGGYSYSRYSYLFSTPVTGDNSGTANLIRIPASREELNDWNFSENGGTVDGERYTADMQRDDFWAYIQQDSYLKNHKGEYAERGGARMPWHHQLDFKYVRDISVKIGNTRHALQLGLDVMNLPNLLCKDWGAYKQINSNSLLTYRNNAYTYNLVNNARHLKTSDVYKSAASAYQIMFSLRYNFN